jgi:DHA1 family bicyclomycin/chloramphenicol resistance-like MFS transporter
MNFQPQEAGRTGLSRRQPVPVPLILLLIAASAISPLALNIFVPSMPGMRSVFAVDFATVQLTLSLYFAGIAVSQVVIGPLSDRFGRRPVLLVGIALFVVASGVCATTTSIDALILGRIVQAAGGCTGIVLSRAMVRDLFDRDQAASMLGYVTMGMAVVPMLAPAIGGVIDTWYGWRATFVLVGLVGAVVLVLIYARLPETNRSRVGGSVGSLLRAHGGLIRSLPFWGYTLTAAFGSLCFFAFLSGASYVMTEVLGRSTAEYGIYFALAAPGYILGNYLSGRLAARRGTRSMILTGNCVTLLGTVLMAGLFAAGFNHPVSLFGPMVMIGAGNGMMLPSAIAGAVSVKPELAGAAAGLSGTCQMGFGALVSPVVGALLDRTAWPLVAVMMAGALLAVLAHGLVLIGQPKAAGTRQ